MPQVCLLRLGVFILLSLAQTNCYSSNSKTYLKSFKNLLSEGSIEEANDLNEIIYIAYTSNKIQKEVIKDLQMQISDYLYDERLFETGLEYFSKIYVGKEFDDLFVGHKHYHLGRFYNSLNNKKNAAIHLIKAKKLLTGTKYMMPLYMELGELNTKCDESKASLEFLTRALSLTETHTYNPKTLFRLHSMLVGTFLSNSDINKAEYHLVKLQHYSQILKKDRYSIKTDLVEAGLYFNTGRHKAAFQIINSLNLSAIKTPGFVQIVNFYKGLGYMSEENNLESIHFLKKSVDNTDGVKAQELAMYHKWLGISYRRDCQYEKAKHHFYEARKLYLAYEDMFHYKLRPIYAELGYVYHLSGDNSEALKYYIVGKEVVNPNSVEVIFSNENLIGQYAEQLKENYSSTVLDQLFILMNETEQLVQDWNFSRRHISEDTYGDYPMRFFYRSSLEVLYFLYQYTKSDLVLDRLINYSSALQSYLYYNNKVNFDPFKGSRISEKLMEEEKALKNEVIDIKRQYEIRKQEKGLLISNEKLFYLDSIQLLEKEYKEFMVSNASFESLQYYNWQKPNFGLKDVQDVLTSEEAVISYYNSGDVFYTNLITKDDVAVFSKELNSENLKLIDEYYGAIAKPELVDKLSFENAKLKYSSIAFKLYKFLLKDQVDKLSPKHKHLIIIPDNGMNSIPFKSLLTEEPNEEDSFKNYPFLVRSHSVAYEYSLQSFLNHKHKKRKSHKHSYVGMAPIYQTPSKDVMKTYAEHSETRSYTDFILRGSLVDLPAARQSVTYIAKQFDDGIAIIGEKATKSNFEKYVDDADIMHFAMHAVMDSDNPELSQLLFSGLDEQKNIYAYQLFNQNMDIELVMLSACDTGAGLIDSGNSLQNMSQAFSLAGCSSLTMSFYKIPDIQTGMIDKYFIEHLKKGERVDEALRLSNLTYLEKSSDYFAHPFYWSGIVMSGKTDPLYGSSHSQFKIF